MSSKKAKSTATTPAPIGWTTSVPITTSTSPKTVKIPSLYSDLDLGILSDKSWAIIISNIDKECRGYKILKLTQLLFALNLSVYFL